VAPASRNAGDFKYRKSNDERPVARLRRGSLRGKYKATCSRRTALIIENKQSNFIQLSVSSAEEIKANTLNIKRAAGA
jgi:hypothetical protein